MKPILLSTCAVTIFLSGCGSSSDGSAVINDETVPLDSYGVIRVDFDRASAQTQLDAVFCDLDSPTAAANIDLQFLTEIDSCTVSNEGAADVAIAAPLACSAALPAQSVSAGANLTVSSAAGTFADLAQQEIDETISYSANTSLPRPPTGLTMDIPGEIFPQFSAVQIPDLQELIVESPVAGEFLRSDTTITWDAATDDTNSRLLLTASDANVTVDCSLADDGAFNFSDATQAELGELFAAGTFSISRQNLTSPTRGDSGLVIITSIK